MYVMCSKCWGFFSLVIRQTVCVDSSLSKVKVKTVDWNRGTPHSQSMSDVAYINKSYISTSTFCRFPGLPTILLLRVEVPGTSAYGHFERNTASHFKCWSLIEYRYILYKYDGRLFLFISFRRYIHTVIVIYPWTGLVWKHQESFSDWF